MGIQLKTQLCSVQENEEIVDLCGTLQGPHVWAAMGSSMGADLDALMASFNSHVTLLRNLTLIRNGMLFFSFSLCLHCHKPLVR